MKHITILVPDGEGNNLSSIIGAYKILSRANWYWQQNNDHDLYSIQLAGSSEKVGYYNELFSVKPHTLISEVKRTNLIIIPSLNHDYKSAAKKNKTMISWIEKQYKNGAEVAAICTGAFLLADCGLLNGKSCSTHWAASESFRTMFPKVNIKADKLITDENGIYTNGGAYSFLNLLIYLVEKYFDRQTAIYCSKVFQIEMDRNNQSQFAIFTGQKLHGDDVVIKAQEILEKNLTDKISIKELTTKLSVGRRNFDRRFIKATGNTPTEYSQRVKMEAAKKSLESTRKTVNEVMYDVGYSDQKAFREVFRKITGMSPVEYRERYNGEIGE
ncbi:MAG: GlxA family transcriptional regulator [Bacteroidota bacterium]